MRNWNFWCSFFKEAGVLVYRLPMRNWNVKRRIIMARVSASFIDYLWGIETGSIASGRPHRRWFIDYLWGIETYILNLLFHHEELVYRLPMRNWNSSTSVGMRYPVFVYRLPMRNWNKRKTHKSTNGNTVYRLPMRNWNVI